MIQCSHCGQGNADQSQFCRFCGNRLALQPAPEHGPTDYRQEPPRPYSWKTDEYQTQAERRVQPISGPAPMVPMQPMPVGYVSPQFMAGSYHCPNCGTSMLPIVERRISTAGWITFALLLVFTLIFFWIGLLIKENVTVCPVCRVTLS